MATTITTVSVDPKNADRLREIRDEKDLPSMDAALEELLKQRGD